MNFRFGYTVDGGDTFYICITLLSALYITTVRELNHVVSSFYFCIILHSVKHEHEQAVYTAC